MSEMEKVNALVETDGVLVGGKMMVAGLMRGQASSHKQGYGPRAAWMATCNYLAIPYSPSGHDQTGSPIAGALLAYADGFADGMAEEDALPGPRSA